MELKDFVKGVILDITNAVKESQRELDNGAIICPTNSNAKETVNSSKDGTLPVSSIDFEVSVSAGSSNETGGKITVLSAVISGGLGSVNTTKDENVSKVRFSIPVILPYTFVQRKTLDSGMRYL